MTRAWTASRVTQAEAASRAATDALAHEKGEAAAIQRDELAAVRADLARVLTNAAEASAQQAKAHARERAELEHALYRALEAAAQHAEAHAQERAELERLLADAVASAVQAGEEHWILRLAPMRSSIDSGEQVMVDAAMRRTGAASALVQAPHLAGRTVDVCADGRPVMGMELDEAGEGTLPFEAEDVIAVIRAGARGYVTKAISPTELTSAIHRVAEGDAVFSPRLAGFVLDAFAAGGPVRTTDPELDQLTAREREVLQLIARGYAYKEIARRLSISIKTVESHVSAVLRKLQLSSRHELTRWAADRRLI